MPSCSAYMHHEGRDEAFGISRRIEPRRRERDVHAPGELAFRSGGARDAAASTATNSAASAIERRDTGRVIGSSLRLRLRTSGERHRHGARPWQARAPLSPRRTTCHDASHPRRQRQFSRVSGTSGVRRRRGRASGDVGAGRPRVAVLAVRAAITRQRGGQHGRSGEQRDQTKAATSTLRAPGSAKLIDGVRDRFERPPERVASSRPFRCRSTAWSASPAIRRSADRSTWSFWRKRTSHSSYGSVSLCMRASSAREPRERVHA